MSVVIPPAMTQRYLALDRHTVSSNFLGYDAFGNPQFDTKRTQFGELVFRLKNRSDQTVVGAIANTVVEFAKARKLLI